MFVVRVVFVVIFATCLFRFAVPIFSSRCHLFCPYKRDIVCATYPSWNYVNCSWRNECLVRERLCLHRGGKQNCELFFFLKVFNIIFCLFVWFF